MALDGGKYAPGWAEDAVGSDVVSVAGACALPVNADEVLDLASWLQPGSSSSCAGDPGPCLQMSGALMIGILMLSGVQTQVPQV